MMHTKRQYRSSAHSYRSSGWNESKPMGSDIIRLQFLAGIGIEQQLERDIRLTAHKLSKQLGCP